MQHHETVMKQLEHEKQELLCSLNTVQNRAAIQQFARDTLGMRSITLNQINKLSS
jgi:cell division protein FtsL